MVLVSCQKEHESASQLIMPTGSGTISPLLTRDSTPSSISTMTLSHFKTDLMTRLNIPLNLADRTDNSLHFAYLKYKAFLEANSTLASLCASGEWEGKKPSVTDLIEIFQSKSMWHSHHAKAFSRVADYPEMVSWLERQRMLLPILDFGALKGLHTISRTCLLFWRVKKWVNQGARAKESWSWRMTTVVVAVGPRRKVIRRKRVQSK